MKLWSNGQGETVAQKKNHQGKQQIQCNAMIHRTIKTISLRMKTVRKIFCMQLNLDPHDTKYVNGSTSAIEASCRVKSACSAENGASSFDALPEICGTMNRIVSSLIFVNFCNSCPRSFTLAPIFISTTNFFPLHVTEMLSRFD